MSLVINLLTSPRLMAVLSPVRNVKGAEAEDRPFAKRAHLARQSIALARAMRRGGVNEFQDFILLHRPLLRFLAKRWYRVLCIDREEVEQSCAIGLMRAARLFDPDRGVRFTIYASKSARWTARQLAADIRFPLRLPHYVLPACFAVEQLQQRVLVAEGPQAARDAVEAMLANLPKYLAQAFEVYQRMLVQDSLAKRRWPASKAFRHIGGACPLPEARLLRQEVFDLLHQLVERLDEREREMVRLYHGLDGEPLTLQAIGDRFGLTHQRVRQILDQVYRRLRFRMHTDPEELRGILPG